MAKNALQTSPLTVWVGGGAEWADQGQSAGMEHGPVELEEDFDYEALPNQPLRVTATAGAAAGMFEHLIMFPIDTVKVPAPVPPSPISPRPSPASLQTRMQSLCPCPEKKLNPIQGLTSIMSREGFWRPLRGVSAVALGAGPAHAVYFRHHIHHTEHTERGRRGSAVCTRRRSTR